MTKLSAIAALAATTAFIGGTVYMVSTNGADAYEECRISNIAGGFGSIGGPFELVSETGETVTEKDVFTKPTLVYFGYTFCPDVCPLDAARNGIAADLLAEQGHDIGTVFITVDPERDTPEVLTNFTDAMHPEMVGLTGSLDQVDAAVKAYKAYYNKHDGDEFYLVDHSTFTYLVAPDEGFLEFFRRDQTEDQMVETLACFLEKL